MLGWQLQTMLLKTARHVSERSTGRHVSERSTARHVSERSTAQYVSEHSTARHVSEHSTAQHVSEHSTGHAALRGRAVFNNMAWSCHGNSAYYSKYLRMHFLTQLEKVPPYGQLFSSFFGVRRHKYNIHISKKSHKKSTAGCI